MEQLKKYSPKYFVAKFMLRIDRNFLIREGIRKAKEQGLEIKLGDREILTLKNKKGSLYLPEEEKDVDAIQLIALVADDYPKRTKRYIVNIEKLGM